MAECYSIFYMSPLWVGILAYFLLNDPYTIRDITKAIISIIGLLLIVKPPFIWHFLYDSVKLIENPNDKLGKIVIFFGSFCFAGLIIIMRYIRNSVSPLNNVVSFNLCNAFFSFIFMQFYLQKEIGFRNFILLIIVAELNTIN